MMRFIRTAGFVAALLLCTAPAFAQGAGIEWDTLNQEVMELHRAGHYDRAVVVAKKALDVAEKALGPDHPNVATRAVQRSPIDDLATAFEPVVVQRTAKAPTRSAPQQIR